MLEQTKQAIDNKELSTKVDVSLINTTIRESELRVQKEVSLIETKLIKCVLGTGAATSTFVIPAQSVIQNKRIFIF